MVTYSLEDIRKELYTLIHQFLKEREWVVKEREIDRMRFYKRLRLEKTDDLLRLFFGTIIRIKKEGSIKDFIILTRRIGGFLLWLYQIHLKNQVQMIDDAAEKDREEQEEWEVWKDERH